MPVKLLRKIYSLSLLVFLIHEVALYKIKPQIRFQLHPPLDALRHRDIMQTHKGAVLTMSGLELIQLSVCLGE